MEGVICDCRCDERLKATVRDLHVSDTPFCTCDFLNRCINRNVVDCERDGGSGKGGENNWCGYGVGEAVMVCEGVAVNTNFFVAVLICFFP